MADIFMSYSSADRPRAKALAEELEKLGFDVWWDREIPLGRPYNEIIPEEIEKAQCVLVLWSEQSKQSRWVYEEAVKGRERNVLIPARIEDTELPMGFGLLQAADLTDWEAGEPHPGFDQLVENVRTLLSAPPSEQRSTTATGRPLLRKALPKALWLAMPAALIGSIAVALTFWHSPTRVKLDLVVDRVAFTVGGSGQTPLLEPVDFRALTVERFKVLSFEPNWLVIADPQKYDENRRDAWQVVDWSGALTFRPKDETVRPSARIESPHGEALLAGRLGKLSVGAGAQITLETPETPAGKLPRVWITIDGQQSDLVLTPRGQFLLVANHLSLMGAQRLPFDADSISLRAQLRPRAPDVLVTGDPQTLSIRLRPATALMEFLSAGGTRVTTVEFLRPRPDAQERAWKSTLVADGTLEYPDDPGVPSVKIARDEFIGVDDLDPCSIQGLSLDPERPALRVRLDCKAKSINTRSGEFTTDRTLTVMERIWHSSRIAVLVTIVAAALSITVSGYQLLKSMRGSR